eukprot:g2939.t1
MKRPSNGETTGHRLRRLEKRVCESRKNANDLLELLEAFEGDDTNRHTKLTALNCLRRVFANASANGNLRAVAGEDNGDEEASRSAAQRKKQKGAEAKQRKAGALRAYRVWMRAKFSRFIKCALDSMRIEGDDLTDRKIRVGSLRTLMLFVKTASRTLRKEEDVSYHFGNDIFAGVLRRYVENNHRDEDLRTALVDEYITQFRDVQLYALRNLKRIAERAEEPHVLSNAFDLMLSVRIPTRPAAVDTFLVEFESKKTQEEEEEEEADDDDRLRSRKRKSRSHGEGRVRKLASYRRAHERCWLSLLRNPRLPREIFKRALLVLPKRVIPHMEHPALLCDFLTDAYNAGGVVSLLALEGLFVLIQRHSLEYPQFYPKLYALLTPSIFVVTYRERLLRLLHLCLLSTHIPAYLVAAFLKRLARLCLVAPPSGALFVVPLLYNMLKRHPQCEGLVQRSEAIDEDERRRVDPFLSTKESPRDANAIESSLWELRALQAHYCPAVASMAAVFDEQEREAFRMSDFTATSYAALFDQSVKRGKRAKKPPAKAFQFVDPLTESL